MADQKISDLTELTTLAAGDHLPIVDVSDTSMAASGTTKRIKAQRFLSGMFAKAGYYYGPLMANNQAYTGLEVCRYYPLRVTADGTIDRIGLAMHNTAGDATMTFRMGIYADDDGLPGAKLVEATFPAGQSNWAWMEATISLAVVPGRYWVAQAQNGTGTPGTICGDGNYRAEECPLNSASVFYSRVLYKTSGVTGALPDPASWDWQDTGAPFIGARRS